MGIEKKKEKIDNITAVLMIGTAILADGIQVFLTLILIGPFVNWLISIFAWLTFFFWFYLKGVNFTNNPKKIFTLAGGSLLEALPIIASFPIWTLTISTTIFMDKAESKLGAPVGKIAKLGKIIKT